ncbi:MAG TPA: hypothetical protein VF519_11205 [Mycobacteriales bacterium]|jgi:hypothetical protein
MGRAILGLALAVAALGAGQASAQAVRTCGMTYQPECTVCVEVDGDRVCLPVNPAS